MMTLLSGLLTGAVGKYASTLTLPILLFGTLLLGHQFIGQRDAKLQAQATNVCDADWKTAVRQQERDAARAESVATQEILQGERRINSKLSSDLESLNARYQDALDRASSDPRCLSDGVLRSLDGPGSDLPGPQGSRASSRKK